MAHRITGQEYPLAKIFSAEFDYYIPSYQRAYCWTEEEAGLLFDDLYHFYQSKLGEDYFLGSIVLIKDPYHPHAEVIDGQQRLTTLILLFSTLTLLLPPEHQFDFYSYVREPGRISQSILPKTRLALRGRDRDFFEQLILSLDFKSLFDRPVAALDNEAQRNIQANSRLFVTKFKEIAQQDPQHLLNFGAFLVQRCYLVVVSTPDQASALRIFTVLNNRGLGLSTADILKARIIGMIEPELRIEYGDRWDSLEIMAGRDGFLDLLQHICFIYHPIKSTQTIIQIFEECLLSGQYTGTQLIADILEPYTHAYIAIQRYRARSGHYTSQIIDLIRSLSMLDNKDWLAPMLLFHVKHYRNDQSLEWFLRRLERLAAYLHLSRKNLHQRMARYAGLIKGLQRDIFDLRYFPEIELSVDEKQRFAVIINSDVFLLPENKRQYLMLRLNQLFTPNEQLITNATTFDLVLPKVFSEDSGWHSAWSDKKSHQLWVHRLANIVILDKPRNNKAQFLSFTEKKAQYLAADQHQYEFALTQQVMNTKEWTPAILEKRQKELVMALLSNWELISV